MPFDVRQLHAVEPGLGLTNRATLQGQHHAPGRSGSPDELGGHPDRPFGSETEDTLVEQLVMQSTQTKSVGQLIGSFEGPPADMRGIQPDHGAVQPAVVLAERTAVLVGHEDMLAECWIAAELLLTREGLLTWTSKLE